MGRSGKNIFLPTTRPYHFLNEKDYEGIVREVGLKIIHIETTAHVAKFQGKKGFEDYVRGWLPFLLNLPKSLHDELLEEIGHQSPEFAPLDKGGYVNHPYQTLVMFLEHTHRP